MLTIPRTFDLGSNSIKVAVVAVFVVTLCVAVIPSLTSAGRLAKWLVVSISSGLLIAQTVFTFGSPEAGVIYWYSFSLAATVVLPAVAVLLVIGVFRNESRRFVLPHLGICILLGMLCLFTT